MFTICAMRHYPHIKTLIAIISLSFSNKSYIFECPRMRGFHLCIFYTLILFKIFFFDFDFHFILSNKKIGFKYLKCVLNVTYDRLDSSTSNFTLIFRGYFVKRLIDRVVDCFYFPMTGLNVLKMLSMYIQRDSFLYLCIPECRPSVQAI